MARIPTPYGPAWMEEGWLLRLEASDGRAALWALGFWHGLRAGPVLVLGLARAEGKLSLLEKGERARRNDSLVAGLGIRSLARRKLARAGARARSLWGAYARGAGEGLSGYRLATPENLAAWDLLFASLPEAGRLFSRPVPFRASNAAALGARRVRGGGALLWLDPHVPRRPRGDLFLHPLLVRSPEYTACGLARAGSPFVLAGSGPRLAWTLCSSWVETVRERRGPAGRGWWRPPGEGRYLRPAFPACPLPSFWAFEAARSRSAPLLARRSASAPPLAHTHLVAADGKGRIAWCLGISAEGGGGGPVDLGGRDGFLVQCNATPGWIRPGRKGKAAPRDASLPGPRGEDASWRHLRALGQVERLLEGGRRARPAELEDLARDTFDGGALRLVRAVLERSLLPPSSRRLLAGFRGRGTTRSRKASLAYLLQGALIEEAPSLEGALHLEGALENLLSRIPGPVLEKTARRALRRWEHLGRPPWGRIHAGRPGSLDTLLAFGGEPWGPECFGAGEGSLLPMVVRLTEKGSFLRLLDPEKPGAPLSVRLPAGEVR